MSSDESFVRQTWEDCALHNLGEGYWEVALGGEFRVNSVRSKSRAWEQAAEFTRERLEEIRQLEMEIWEQPRVALLQKVNIQFWADIGASYEEIVRHVVLQCRRERTLDRLTALLEEKKRGMRETKGDAN